MAFGYMSPSSFVKTAWNGRLPYNNEHRHSGIAYMTPAMVHCEQSDEIVAKRQSALDNAYEKHSLRFGFKRPKAKKPPQEVGINLPKDDVKQKSAA